MAAKSSLNNFSNLETNLVGNSAGTVWHRIATETRIIPQIRNRCRGFPATRLRHAVSVPFFGGDPDELEEDDAPATADAEDLLRPFLEGEVLPWFETRKKELAS
jgi:hypothetical protein